MMMLTSVLPVPMISLRGFRILDATIPAAFNNGAVSSKMRPSTGRS
jgi:hypothetical protein